MLSIGVLLAYTVVAISIIILRSVDWNPCYRYVQHQWDWSAYAFSLHRFSQTTEATINSERYIETSNLLRPGYNITAKGFAMQLIRLNASRQPNTISMWVVGSMIVCYCLLSFALGGTIIYGWDAIANGETWALVVTILLATFLVIFCILISIQPRQKFLNHVKPFKVYCPRHFHILSSASMKRFSFFRFPWCLSCLQWAFSWTSTWCWCSIATRGFVSEFGWFLVSLYNKKLFAWKFHLNSINKTSKA